MTGWNSAGMTAIVAGATVLLVGCASMSPPTGGPADRILGVGSGVGEGTVSSYAEIDGSGVLAAIGVVFSATALDGLPVGSDRHHCLDRNEDGGIDEAHECIKAYEYVIPLPDAVARRSEVPFKWVLLNWNPGGHIPPGVYDIPHFDVHFYMEPIAKIFALESGLCGPEFMRCDQYEVARKPPPQLYAFRLPGCRGRGAGNGEPPGGLDVARVPRPGV